MTNWIERRLERQHARAKAGDCAAWRALANLAAAYGRGDLAREAHLCCGGSASGSTHPVAPAVERIEIAVRSPTPLARTAWLRRLGSAEIEVIDSREVIGLSGIGARTVEYLRRHPEIEVR